MKTTTLKTTTKKKSIVALSLAATLFAGATTVATACSNFNFTTDNGNTFIGRTMEWPGELDAKMSIVPQNHKLNYTKTQYGFVGMEHEPSLFSSGMNEHGLNGEALVLGESQFAPEGEGKLLSGDVVGYVLANAKNVQEAIKILKETKVEVGSYEVIKGLHLSTHYAFNDGTRSVVVEYLDGSGYPEIFENKIGVLTNDPNYPTQEFLANSMLDGGKARFSEENFVAYDQSPIGRFQKLVATQHTQDLQLVESDYDAINRAWNMINTVDIPHGTLYWRFASELPQFTSYANVVDIANKDYYFRTYDNMDIRKVDLNNINFSTVSYQSNSIFNQKDSYTEYSVK
ncbi:linear amide C-N hydrolase [Vibrio amylolyticus]|uniref:linear amide C-N hydrolase n=1 Tax=Vibrio amylolyticus TaxID=2847292 RepID=UPI0035513B4B